MTRDIAPMRAPWAASHPAPAFGVRALTIRQTIAVSRFDGLPKARSDILPIRLPATIFSRAWTPFHIAPWFMSLD